MLDCLERLGTTFGGSLETGLHVEPNLNTHDLIELNARQSGVSLRLLLGVAALRSGRTHFVGDESLANRPNDGLLNAISELGCKVESNHGKLPIKISGTASPQERVMLDSSRSSQFLSALLLVAPNFPMGLEVALKNELASASYAAGTIGEMGKRSVHVAENRDEASFKVGPQKYRGGTVQIEGDASAATYHMALATLHGGTVRITNVGESSWQPDQDFSGVCELLGATVERTETSLKLSGPMRLRPLVEIDMSPMPDAAPTLMGMTPYLSAPIEISGLDTLRHKECDRIACPAKELSRAGIQVDEGSDTLKIWPGKPQPTTFNTYDDHRMAMSFAVLASKTKDCRIEDPTCVNKTYTNFWRDMSLAYG